MFTLKSKPVKGFSSHTNITKFLFSVLLAGSMSVTTANAAQINAVPVLNGHDSSQQMTSYISRFGQSSDYILSGDFDKAIPLLEEAVEADPINVFAVYNLGYSYLEMAEHTSSSLEADEFLEKAEGSLIRAQNFNPQLDVVYFKLGKIALMKGDSEQALYYYKIGAENLPQNAAMQFNLGRIYDQQGNIGKALTHYEKAIVLDPEFKYSYNNAGLLYEAQGEFKKAEKAYDTALTVDPEYNYARLNLGNLYALQEDFEKAEALYLEALSYEPDNTWAHLYLANVYFMGEKFEEAIPHYQSAVEGQPDNANAYYLMAVAYSKINQYDKALEASSNYLSIDPNGKFSTEMHTMVTNLKLKQFGISLHKETP